MTGLSPIEIYETLFKKFGPQYWWPGDSPLEVIVGAILTQNSSWENVEKAIINLKGEKILDLLTLLSIDISKLAILIRPSGYYNLKAKRLKEIVSFLSKNGGLESLRHMDSDGLRNALLSVNGVGEETADSILLYAFDRPEFVVDAYTRRLLSRLGCIRRTAVYGEVKLFFEDSLPRDAKLFNEFHALIVKLGKDVCRKEPRCWECPLEKVCLFPG
jgi:endonuclease-3 related protein